MTAPDPVRIIAKVDDLPTLPRTVFKITELVNDPQSSAKELARIITEDQEIGQLFLLWVSPAGIDSDGCNCAPGLRRYPQSLADHFGLRLVRHSIRTATKGPRAILGPLARVRCRRQSDRQSSAAR